MFNHDFCLLESVSRATKRCPFKLVTLLWGHPVVVDTLLDHLEMIAWNSKGYSTKPIQQYSAPMMKKGLNMRRNKCSFGILSTSSQATSIEQEWKLDLMRCLWWSQVVLAHLLPRFTTQSFTGSWEVFRNPDENQWTFERTSHVFSQSTIQCNPKWDSPLYVAGDRRSRTPKTS